MAAIKIRTLWGAPVYTRVPKNADFNCCQSLKAKKFESAIFWGLGIATTKKKKYGAV
ncbi:MAG: hypothetical protein LBS83_00060 [Holosporales bacterium]|nr:hypothetical protein [Holosporales bacterium]